MVHDPKKNQKAAAMLVLLIQLVEVQSTPPISRVIDVSCKKDPRTSNFNYIKKRSKRIKPIPLNLPQPITLESEATKKAYTILVKYGDMITSQEPKTMAVLLFANANNLISEYAL